MRIGIIKTGLHGYLYAACWGPYHRQALHTGGGQLDILESACVPVIPFRNTSVACVWDETPEGALNFAKAFDCKVVGDWREMADKAIVDAVFISNTHGTGADHVELSLPFLKAGIPVFIDKPISDDRKKAAEICANAEKYGTPVFSSSLLYYAAALDRLRGAHCGTLRMATVTGGGPMSSRAGSIHTVAALLGLQRADVRAALYLGGAAQQAEIYRLTFADGSVGIINMNGTPADFRLDMYGDAGIATDATPFSEFRYGAVKAAEAFVKMAETGEPPIPYKKLVELIAVMDACEESKARGMEISLAEY